MTRVQAYVYLGAVVLIAFVGVQAIGAVSEAETTEPQTVRWLLAHEPADVYARAVDVFAEELKKESHGTLKLEAVTPAQLGISGQVGHAEIVQLLETGVVELSSTYGVANGTQDEHFWAWQLPFLFDTYEDVETAFASPAGEALLTRLSEQASFRALAYTLSGGFRVLASAQSINSLDDLQGLRIVTAGGPVAEATWRTVGAIPIAADSEEAADADVVETTYARLSSAVGTQTELAQYIAETNHSLFLTTLIVSDSFYDSLSSEQQQALTHAARTAAAVERADAIALNAQTKAALEAGGSGVTVFSETERAAFEGATASVYDTFVPVFGAFVSAVR